MLCQLTRAIVLTDAPDATRNRNHTQLRAGLKRRRESVSGVRGMLVAYRIMDGYVVLTR